MAGGIRGHHEELMGGSAAAGAAGAWGAADVEPPAGGAAGFEPAAAAWIISTLFQCPAAAAKSNGEYPPWSRACIATSDARSPPPRKRAARACPSPTDAAQCSAVEPPWYTASLRSTLDSSRARASTIWWLPLCSATNIQNAPVALIRAAYGRANSTAAAHPRAQRKRIADAAASTAKGSVTSATVIILPRSSASPGATSVSESISAAAAAHETISASKGGLVNSTPNLRRLWALTTLTHIRATRGAAAGSARRASATLPAGCSSAEEARRTSNGAASYSRAATSPSYTPEHVQVITPPSPPATTLGNTRSTTGRGGSSPCHTRDPSSEALKTFPPTATTTPSGPVAPATRGKNAAVALPASSTSASLPPPASRRRPWPEMSALTHPSVRVTNVRGPENCAYSLRV
mmetsp:Transcript_25608/g.81260  ORF Transcript_25608/g.81260 Transcript_25608/m.81260 type:complete len:406 (-) Transcript_25608:915-2132(-)